LTVPEVNPTIVPMNRKIGWALLCVPLFCLTIWAQKESDYHTGRLLKVTDYSDPGSASLNLDYLLHIRDGSNDYFARYRSVFIFGHDRSNLLKADSDVQYRVSGKDLYVKTSDNKEIKARVCTKITYRAFPGVQCGSDRILGGDFSDSGKTDK